MWRGHKEKREAKWKAKIERSHQLGVEARKAWKAKEAKEAREADEFKLFMNAFSILRVYAEDKIRDMSVDELLIVIDNKKGGEELASKLLHELYPQLVTHFDNKSIRCAVKKFMSDEKEAVEKYGPIQLWNVSNVTKMNSMFSRYHTGQYLTSFPKQLDISRWDVSNVTNMRCMFYECYAFNSNLSRWDVSKVTESLGMFKYCDDMDEAHKPKFTSSMENI